MTEGGDDESDSCVLVQSLFVNFMWSSRVLQVAEADGKSGGAAATVKPSTTTTAKPTGSASGSPAALTLLVAPLLLSTVLLHGWSG